MGSSLAVGLPTVGVLVDGIGSQYNWVVGHNYKWPLFYLWMKLCSGMVGCLSWAFPGLMLTHRWASKPLVLMVLSVSVSLSQNGDSLECQQSLYLRVVSSDLSGRLSKMSSWFWPRLLSNYFFSILTQRVRFCTQSLIAEFLFPISSHCPVHMSPCPSNQRVPRGLSSSIDPGCEVFCGSWNPYSLGESLCNCDYTPICGSPIQRCQFSLDHISVPPYPSYSSCFGLYL